MYLILLLFLSGCTLFSIDDPATPNPVDPGSVDFLNLKDLHRDMAGFSTYEDLVVFRDSLFHDGLNYYRDGADFLNRLNIIRNLTRVPAVVWHVPDSEGGLSRDPSLVQRLRPARKAEITFRGSDGEEVVILELHDISVRYSVEKDIFQIWQWKVVEIDGPADFSLFDMRFTSPFSM